jgi:hypothetical protein
MAIYRGDIMPALRQALNNCDDDEVRKYLRRGLAFMLHKGPLKATTERVVLHVGEGNCLTLPGRYEALLNVWTPRTSGHWRPITIRNHWFEGYGGGPGIMEPDKYHSRCKDGQVIAQGVNYVSFGDVRKGERIAVRADHQHNPPKFIYLGGTNQDGQEVTTFDGQERVDGGERIEIRSDRAVLSATIWDAHGLRKVRKDPTHGAVNLWAVAGSTMRPIATYGGPETNPSYRRYTLAASHDGQIIAQCKLALPPLRYDDEEIPCANEEAIVLAAKRAMKLETEQYEGVGAITATIMELLADEANEDAHENAVIPINVVGQDWMMGGMDTV